MTDAPTCAQCGSQYEPDVLNDPGSCWLCRVHTTRNSNLSRLEAATIPRLSPTKRSKTTR